MTEEDFSDAYRVALPAGLELLNANAVRKMHWSRERAIAREIRSAAKIMARVERVPHMERIRVIYVVHPPPLGRRRDQGNWSPTGKAAVDGIVDAGVVSDDDHEHVLGPDPRMGDPVPKGQLVLYIFDLSEEVPCP